MKKNFIIIFSLILTLLFIISCGGNEGKKVSTYELALVTDAGTIDDRSFNQGAWEGISRYAKEKDISYKYYQPSQKNTDAYFDAIDLAVNAGAKLVVTPGFLFEAAMYKAQDLHKDTKFVLLDFIPKDPVTGTVKVGDNVSAILYAEEEAGFLAGYSIVKEGYTNLGFMGGIAVPAVIRFGYGFVQGVEYAAKELNLPKESVKIDYIYVGSFTPSPEIQTLATSWYRNGVQVIFATAGGAGNSVMAAAEQNNGLVIGVDVDQSKESPTVITSAVKMIADSVYDDIDDFYNSTFRGGEVKILDAKVRGIGLALESSKFKKFTTEDYDSIYQKLVDGTVRVSKDDSYSTVLDIPLEFVKVNFVQ